MVAKGRNLEKMIIPSVIMIDRKGFIRAFVGYSLSLGKEFKHGLKQNNTCEEVSK